MDLKHFDPEFTKEPVPGMPEPSLVDSSLINNLP